ncbi:MAG: HAMP domain-containing histidine kinase [Verrucomicrobiae bacterium]|nr:HAMP domain-containing histidine kinase [Verrucomicrobiae bacterium]
MTDEARIWKPTLSPHRQQIRLTRRLTRHFIVLCVTFGLAGISMTWVGFHYYFAPLLERVNADWIERERAAIRSVGGLEAAVITTPLLSLLDMCAEQRVMLWAQLKQHPQLAYLRLANTVNAEIAWVHRDEFTRRELPEPSKLEWDRSFYPPRVKDRESYEKLRPVWSAGRQFYERRLLLYRESFGRMFPIAVLSAGFDEPPPSLAEADRICDACLAPQVIPGAKGIEGWPAGRVLTDDSLLVRYSYELRDAVLYLADVKKGTDNLEVVTMYDRNGVPLLSELQSDPTFQFQRGLKGDLSLVRLTAHVRQRIFEEVETSDEAAMSQAYEVFVPVFRHGGLRGMMAFGLRGQASLMAPFRMTIQQIQRMMVTSTIALTTLMILASVIMALRLHWRIARPLEAISQAARDFVHGELTAPEHLQRATELAQRRHYTREDRRLCEAYSRMVSVIQETLKEKDAAYAELQTTQKQLLASQRQSLLGVVAAGVAHEIKNALNPVKLRAERMLMAHQMKREVALEEGLNLIIQSVVRCAEISNKLSQFAKPSDAASHYDFDLNETLRDALTITHDVLATSKVQVTTQLDDLPHLHGSPKEIQQALINFLLNAKDAILDARAKQDRAEAGHVTVSTAPKGDFVELRISDDGCGMTEETKQKMFVPFFTTKEPGKGTGLGMGISQSILQAHGAEIKIESEWAKGTTLIVRFPIPHRDEKPASNGAAAKT